MDESQKIAAAALATKVSAHRRILGILTALPEAAREDVLTATAAFFGRRFEQESVEIEVRHTRPASDPPPAE